MNLVFDYTGIESSSGGLNYPFALYDSIEKYHKLWTVPNYRLNPQWQRDFFLHSASFHYNLVCSYPIVEYYKRGMCVSYIRKCEVIFKRVDMFNKAMFHLIFPIMWNKSNDRMNCVGPKPCVVHKHFSDAFVMASIKEFSRNIF